MARILIRLIIGLIASAVLISFAACGGTNNNSTNFPAGSGSQTALGASPSSGTMKAKVDGKTWTADSVTTARYSFGFLEIGGTDNSSPAEMIGINVKVDGPGTYQLSQLEEASAFALLTIGDTSWQASNVAGSGTVTVSTLTSTGASGAFSLSLEPKPNNPATGTKIITDGAFNITFATTGITASTTPGGTITAQVNGQAFTGTVLKATFTDRFLTLTAADSQGNIIDIELGAVSGPGTYSLSSHNSSSSSAYFKFKVGDTWGTVLPGGTGSAVITAMDSGRVVGTFSFDGPDETGSGTGAVHVTSGRFDVTY